MMAFRNGDYTRWFESASTTDKNLDARAKELASLINSVDDMVILDHLISRLDAREPLNDPSSAILDRALDDIVNQHVVDALIRLKERSPYGNT
jgi:ribosome assembly protein YihI (activator of Der GTPase)